MHQKSACLYRIGTLCLIRPDIRPDIVTQKRAYKFVSRLRCFKYFC